MAISISRPNPLLNRIAKGSGNIIFTVTNMQAVRHSGSAFLIEGIVHYCESGSDRDGLCKVGHFQVPVHFTNDNAAGSENKNHSGFPVTIKDMTESIHNTAERFGFPF